MSDLCCSKTSGFVHQHLALSVGIDTKSCVGSLSFFHLHRESEKSQNAFPLVHPEASHHPLSLYSGFVGGDHRRCRGSDHTQAEQLVVFCTQLDPQPRIDFGGVAEGGLRRDPIPESAFLKHLRPLTPLNSSSPPPSLEAFEKEDVRQLGEASADFVSSGGMRTIELSRVFLDTLIEETDGQRLKAVFPDAGAAALLKYHWKDAAFGFASEGEGGRFLSLGWRENLEFILAKKGPLGRIWIADHLERKLRKNQQGVPTASPVVKTLEIGDEKKKEQSLPFFQSKIPVVCCG
ncbi:hypothetical protein ACFX13_007093 [Malus domestica]